MDNQGLLERIRTESGILVAGKDMFGAEFTERTRLMGLSAQGLMFPLYRPLVEDLTLCVHLHTDREEASVCITGIVTRVKNRLDGMQTVEMQTLEVSVIPTELPFTNDLQPKPPSSQEATPMDVPYWR